MTFLGKHHQNVGLAAALSFAGCVLLVGNSCQKRFDPAHGELVRPGVAPAIKVATNSKAEALKSRLRALKDETVQRVDPDGDKQRKVGEYLRERTGQSARVVGDVIGVGTELETALELTDEEVSRLGRQVAQALDNKHRILAPTHPQAERVSALVSPHAGIFGDASGRKLSVKLYDDATVNAFALPDGSIRFHRGLLELATDEELAGVFGHEIGHVVEGHSKDQMRRSLLALAGSKMLLRAMSGHSHEEMSEDIAPLLVKLGQEVLARQFSQRAEKEADDYALEFMLAYGHDSAALISLFEKFHARGKNRIGGFFSTHPSPLERAQRIKEALE